MEPARRVGLSFPLDRHSDFQHRHVDAECRRRLADDVSDFLTSDYCARPGGVISAGISRGVTRGCSGGSGRPSAVLDPNPGMDARSRSDAWCIGRLERDYTMAPLLMTFALGLGAAMNTPAWQATLPELAVFTLGASGLWALLPVRVKAIDLGASGYGFLLGCLGAGASAGVFLLPKVRRAFSPDFLAAIGTAVFALCILALALTETLYCWPQQCSSQELPGLR